MKKVSYILTPILFFFIACQNIPFLGGVKGEGPMEKTERSVSGFTGVVLLASADVNIKQGNTFKVIVDGQKNITELLETVVENGNLKIRFKNSIGNVQYDKLIVSVEAPTFNNIQLAGSGNIVVENSITSSTDFNLDISGSGNLITQTITSPAMDIDVSGSGDLTIKDIQTEKTKTGLTGSGNIHISGKSTTSEYTVSGSGDIDCSALITQNVNAYISGSGNIHCHADVNLDANVSGSGDIIYSGTPSVKSRISGSGEISSKN